MIQKFCAWNTSDIINNSCIQVMPYLILLLGTPTPRQNFKAGLKGSKEKNNKPSPLTGNVGLSSNKKKGKNCRELPKQNCQRLRVNPKPVWKNMTRKICRVPRTLTDKQLVQQVPN